MAYSTRHGFLSRGNMKELAPQNEKNASAVCGKYFFNLEPLE